LLFFTKTCCCGNARLRWTSGTLRFFPYVSCVQWFFSDALSGCFPPLEANTLSFYWPHFFDSCLLVRTGFFSPHSKSVPPSIPQPCLSASSLGHPQCYSSLSLERKKSRLALSPPHLSLLRPCCPCLFGSAFLSEAPRLGDILSEVSSFAGIEPDPPPATRFFSFFYHSLTAEGRTLRPAFVRSSRYRNL